MPALGELLPERAGVASLLLEPKGANAPSLVERVYIPYNSYSAPSGLTEALTVDPWSNSGKYALGWVYFCIVLLVFTVLTRLYFVWNDKIRTASHKDRIQLPDSYSVINSPETPYELTPLETDRSINKLFPRGLTVKPSSPVEQQSQSSLSSIKPLNQLMACFRYFFYWPLPIIHIRKGWRPIAFPSLATLCIVLAALAFVTLYTFLQQPLYWQSIRYGSPPVAVRSGMIAVAMIPWLVAMSMKANFISLITGIGHERLNVLHRWGGWLCLFLSLIHTIPFYIQPIWDNGGYKVFRNYFGTGIYVYGTGFAALVPLCFLCLHSLPMLRNWMYELFVAVHVPAAIVFVGMMIWHCNNYLASWSYLWATIAIWVGSYLFRLFFLNWTNPRNLSWMVGDEAAVTIMPENAIKITIPTQKRWRPGQYVYLRMPGISIFENHPFTVASLCSEDFPSEYGDDHRDMILVFRPYSGFTRKVLQKAIEGGPWQTYRAFIDGPYGGVSRSLDSFDTLILIAGGSGITALVSHLLDLIKRMRDGKAVTRRVHIIWALKRPEVMEWFKEELRICREFAPPDTVTCRFYITAAKRQPATGQLVSAQTPGRTMDRGFHDAVNGAFQDIANKRHSHLFEGPGINSQRHSALIHDEAQGDLEKEHELRRENEDGISALPQAHIVPVGASQSTASPIPAHTGPLIGHPMPVRSINSRLPNRHLALDIAAAVASNPGAHLSQQQPHAEDYMSASTGSSATAVQDAALSGFNFGFPTTPTEFQKNLMRFAFLPAAPGRRRDGWGTEYGRPDLPYMLRQESAHFKGRAAVFVCGPPGMRVAVQRTVAELQASCVLKPGSQCEELFLHTENYAL